MTDEEKKLLEQMSLTLQAVDSVLAAYNEACDENKRLLNVLNTIADRDAPRSLGSRYRNDGVPSKNDLCIHYKGMWDECVECVADYARAALVKKEDDVS